MIFMHSCDQRSNCKGDTREAGVNKKVQDLVLATMDEMSTHQKLPYHPNGQRCGQRNGTNKLCSRFVGDDLQCCSAEQRQRKLRSLTSQFLQNKVNQDKGEQEICDRKSISSRSEP